MQRNFILTDVMKTGFHQDLEDFIDLNTLKDQHVEHLGQYYDLHAYDLDSYDRKFAIIDYRQDNHQLDSNNEFRDELKRRCELLHSQGFKFIKATPWESMENIQAHAYFPDIEIEHIKWTGQTSWFWFYMYRKHCQHKVQCLHKKKQYDFLYLNKHSRDHRTKLFRSIMNNNLLDNSLFSFHEHKPKYTLPEKYEVDYPIRGADQDMNYKLYEDTKFSIVSEANVNDNDIFMTEKIWKPIIAQQPFVVHGNHLYLQRLRELGFKTFSTYFDESYDLENNHDIKVQKLTSLIKDLKNMDSEDLYLHSQALRLHNYNTFFDSTKLGSEIDKTLISFFEFADGS